MFQKLYRFVISLESESDFEEREYTFPLELDIDRFMQGVVTFEGGVKKIKYMEKMWAFNRMLEMMKVQQKTEKLVVRLVSFEKRQEKKVCQEVLDILYGLMIHLREEEENQKEEKRRER